MVTLCLKLGTIGVVVGMLALHYMQATGVPVPATADEFKIVMVFHGSSDHA